ARILWPLSSWTRNIAFGNVSATVPCISIISSFGTDRYPFFPIAANPTPLYLTQDPGWPTLLNCNRMFKMGGEATICGHCRPTIVEHPDGASTHIHHWLDRKNHPPL